jgi:hypothetical protein
MSHSRCASSTILGNLFVDLTPSLLTHISADMGFGASGVSSPENLSSLLEEFSAGMAQYHRIGFIFLLFRKKVFNLKVLMI